MNHTEKRPADQKDLICRNLTLGYEGNALIRDLSFEVGRGDYLCIIGENGAGKTTLMRTILRLLKPMSGEIRFSDGIRPSEIGYLPQQTAVQKDFPASVSEVVLSGCQARLGRRFFYSQEEKKLARKNMERLGIDNLADHCYRELSGGQQQRVLLARALCATERVLLLDEPVSGLDPEATQTMYELIRKINREGITIIMISHDILSAMQYADHILHIGKDVFFGTTEEYRRSVGGHYSYAGPGFPDAAEVSTERLSGDKGPKEPERAVKASAGEESDAAVRAFTGGDSDAAGNADKAEAISGTDAIISVSENNSKACEGGEGHD